MVFLGFIIQHKRFQPRDVSKVTSAAPPKRTAYFFSRRNFALEFDPVNASSTLKRSRGVAG